MGMTEADNLLECILCNLSDIKMLEAERMNLVDMINKLYEIADGNENDRY